MPESAPASGCTLYWGGNSLLLFARKGRSNGMVGGGDGGLVLLGRTTGHLGSLALILFPFLLGLAVRSPEDHHVIPTLLVESGNHW
jgi:hypothetical protein